jgi:hypothetical protein
MKANSNGPILNTRQEPVASLAPLLAEVLELADCEVDVRLPSDELARRLEQIKAAAEASSSRLSAAPPEGAALRQPT